MLKIKKGFTLIELLVVATIIATLIGIASVSYVRATKSSRDARRKTDLEQIRQAMETFRAETGAYPATGSLSSLSPNYITTIPTGPKVSSDPSDVYTYSRTTTTTYNLCATLEIATPASYCVHEP